jgi:hypothetical protein
MAHDISSFPPHSLAKVPEWCRVDTALFHDRASLISLPPIAPISSPSRRAGGSEIRAALGLNEAVVNNVPQQSLRRLQDADLVLRMDYGDYRMQDDALAKWLRNQELED